MTNASSGKIRDLINAYLGVDDKNVLGGSGSGSGSNDPNTINGTYFMNEKSDYDYTPYRNGVSWPKKLTDENGKWIGDDSGKGWTTQQNNRNGGEGDEKPPEVINGNKDGIKPGGYINYNGSFDVNKIANKKFISIIAISPGGGAGGSGAGELNPFGGGGGPGIGFIGDITLFGGVTITDCDVQVGGGGVGGNSGSKQNKSHDSSRGNNGFIGGNTVITIKLSDGTTISIDLSSGNPGSYGEFTTSHTSGNRAWVLAGPGISGDVGHINISIVNTKQQPGVVPEFIDNVLQYNDKNDRFAFTFKKYPGTVGEGIIGGNGDMVGNGGGQITNDFYNQLGYFKDMKNADGKTVAQVVNSDLNYSFQNSDLTIYDIKLGSGGLSASYTDSKSTAHNSTSGRAGFVSLFTYDSKPVDYPDVIGESPDMDDFIPVDFDITVSGKDHANTKGPVWVEVYSENKSTPQVIHGNEVVNAISDTHINGFKYFLNKGGEFAKKNTYKNIFYVNKDLGNNFYVKLSSNTTDAIFISKITMKFNNKTVDYEDVSNAISGNEWNGYYATDDNSVGWLELKTTDNNPSVRWLDSNYDPTE